MNELERFQRYGYKRCREQQLRDLFGDRPECLAMENANQIRHLKHALSKLVLSVETSNAAGGDSIADAELVEARIALGA